MDLLAYGMDSPVVGNMSKKGYNLWEGTWWGEGRGGLKCISTE